MKDDPVERACQNLPDRLAHLHGRRPGLDARPKSVWRAAAGVWRWGIRLSANCADLAGAVRTAWRPELLCLDRLADAAVVAADSQRSKISAGAAVLVAAAASFGRRAEY